MNLATDEKRAWLRDSHHELDCWRCARYCGHQCKADGTIRIVCGADDPRDVARMVLTPEQANACTGCFRWELKAAAREALARLRYIGMEALPPMARDVVEFLDEAVRRDGSGDGRCCPTRAQQTTLAGAQHEE